MSRVRTSPGETMSLSRCVSGLVLLVVAAPALAAGQAVPLTAGQYDVVISGMPGGETESRPRCLTADHLKNPEAIFTYAYSPKAMVNPSVKVTRFSAAGGHLAYEAETPASLIRVTGTISSTAFSVERATSSKSGKGAPISMKL